MTFEFDERIYLFRILSFDKHSCSRDLWFNSLSLNLFQSTSFFGLHSLFRGKNVEIFFGWTWQLVFKLPSIRLRRSPVRGRDHTISTQIHVSYLGTEIPVIDTTGGQGPMQPWNAGTFEARPPRRCLWWEYIYGVTALTPAKSKHNSTFSSTELLHNLVRLLPSCLVSPQSGLMYAKPHSSSDKATTY